MADADPLTSTAPYPTEQPEILLVDLNGLKLVERGGALGIALSLGRDGLADVVQYARANPDEFLVGENVRWLSWEAWDRLVRAVEAHRSLRATPVAPVAAAPPRPPPLPARTTRPLPSLTIPLPEDTDDGS